MGNARSATLFLSRATIQYEYELWVGVWGEH